MLSEFTFPPAAADRKSKWKARLLQIARTAILSRKSPELPQWATWLFAAIWVAGIGVFMSLFLAFAVGVTVPDTWEVVLLVWLASHQATLITPDGIVSLLPIGLALIPLPLWRRAGRWLEVQYSGRRGARGRATLANVSVYVVICMTGAASLRSYDVRVSVPATIIGAFGVALLGVAWGFRKQSQGRLKLPHALAGGIVAIAWFVAAGAVVLMLALVFSFSDVGAARQALAEDFGGQVGILIVEAAYLPNLIIWAAAYATGTGIAAGGDQTLSIFTSEQPLLPDLPILAAIPTEAPSWAALLPIVILVGGWLAASVAQRQAPVTGLRRRLARAAVLAGLILISWFVALIISGGSLGDGRLEYIGPAPATPFAAAALIGVGATIWALLPTLASDARPITRALRARFQRPDEVSTDAGPVAGGHGESSEPRAGSVSR